MSGVIKIILVLNIGTNSDIRYIDSLNKSKAFPTQ